MKRTVHDELVNGSELVAEISLLEWRLARMQQALEYIARYEYGSEYIGEYAVALKQYARGVLQELELI